MFALVFEQFSIFYESQTWKFCYSAAELFSSYFFNLYLIHDPFNKFLKFKWTLAKKPISRSQHPYPKTKLKIFQNRKSPPKSLKYLSLNPL
jgi:hypothetical protein